jgi:hypothetical protein
MTLHKELKLHVFHTLLQDGVISYMILTRHPGERGKSLWYSLDGMICMPQNQSGQCGNIMLYESL